jgi:hypothetical protein
MDDYLRGTIRWETLFVKGKGQEVWGWSGGFRGESQNPHPLQTKGGAPSKKERERIKVRNP